METGLTPNQLAVVDMATALGPPPPDVGGEYAAACSRACALVGVPVADAASSSVAVDFQRDIPVPLGSIRGSALAPRFVGQDSDGGARVSARNAAYAARNSFIDFVNRAVAASVRSFPATVNIPDSPFAAAARIAAARARAAQEGAAPPELPTPDEADILIQAVRKIVDLVDAPPPARREQSLEPAAQISSFTISVEGYGSAGSTVVDLLRFRPNSAEIREQKTRSELAAFDFKKRVPRFLFLMDYDPAGGSRGTLLGWRRVQDASGYTLIRRELFSGKVDTYTLTNESLATATEQLRDYANQYALSFYDTVYDSQVWLYLDNTTRPDCFYSYKLRAYQVRDASKDRIFTVAVVPGVMDLKAQQKMGLALQSLSRDRNGPAATFDDVNPWPAISVQLYGDNKYDWLLSAVNSRASLNRGDDPGITKKFSYVGAKASSLFSLMGTGQFVAPRDPAEVVRNVNAAISSLGVQQTVAEVLRETGILDYFEGHTAQGPNELLRTSLPESSPLLDGISSAIDFGNSTLDIRSFTANMPQALGWSAPPPSPVAKVGSFSYAVGGPPIQFSAREMSVPDPDVPRGFASSAQYAYDLPAGSPTIDLMTFDGLSALVRIVRLFSESGPARSSSNIAFAVAPSSPPPPAPARRR